MVVYNSSVMVDQPETVIDGAAAAAIASAEAVRMIKDKDGNEYPVTELEMHNGCWYHFEDGFFVAEELPADLMVNDMTSFTAVMERIFNADSAILAIQAEYDAILAAKLRNMKKAQDRADFLRAYFGPNIELWGKTQLKPGKSKTIECPYGSVQYGDVAEMLLMGDAGAALNWAKIAEPTAVVEVPATQVFNFKLLSKDKKAELLAAVKEGGDNPVCASFKYRPAGEKVTIMSTVAKEAKKKAAAEKKAAKTAGASSEEGADDEEA